jgi:hypothetical protein
MKDILYLRFLPLAANTIYIAYGLIIGAIPIIVGSFIAVIIHVISIYRLNHAKQVSLVNSNNIPNEIC